jgi:hypothetical protein
VPLPWSSTTATLLQDALDQRAVVERWRVDEAANRQDYPATRRFEAQARAVETREAQPRGLIEPTEAVLDGMDEGAPESA